MRVQHFLSMVPAGVKAWSWGVAGFSVMAGLVEGYLGAGPGGAVRLMSLYGAAAVLVGAGLAAWLLSIGFVYADAGRRGMRQVPWMLVVIFFPHLLGFLLYFVLRQPVTSVCGQCGGVVRGGQRFCSSCGMFQRGADAGGGSAVVGPSEGV